MRWVITPEESVLRQAQAALADTERSGALLVGPDGVGKTALAQTLCAQTDKTVRWVTGTPAQRFVPFGAFRHLVDVTDIGRPAALLRAARDSLTRDEPDLLLVVDDAHNLDGLSAALVYQLALTRAARLLVIAGSTATLPDAVAALRSDDLLVPVDVVPLDRGPTVALVETALGAPLDLAVADEVFGRSQGNPLYLRHLVSEGGLKHQNALPLAGVIDDYLSGLPAPARVVLDYLAITEPLARADLSALAGGQAVSDAEVSGAVRPGYQDELFAAHPLYTERARAALTPDGARVLRTAVVTQLSKHRGDHVSDRLRLSVLAVDSDNPEPVEVAVAAAEEALRLGDLPLAERLARAALDRSGALAARLPLAHALGWQGRGREAGAVLAEVDPAELSETELMAWAVPRAANQFWMLDEPERATAFLQTTRNRVSDPTARSALDALTATFAMNSGNLQRAVALATEVLSDPSDSGMGTPWAASAAALCSARMGRWSDVDRLAERAAATEHPGLLRFTVGLGQITALLMSGDVEAAQALAQRFTDFAESQQPGRAIGEVLLADVLLVKGEFSAAAQLLEPAAATLERTGYSWGPLSLMLLATARAQQGDIPGSAKALRRAETRHGTKSGLFAPELGLARAWTKAAARDKTAAITAAREAARAAERAGQLGVALRAQHDAVRLGDVRAVLPISQLVGQIHCATGQLALSHAQALADADADALAAVAEQLAAAGMAAAAADAARAAHELR
ncbi:ATP-binding protein [Mycobacterium kubicae]|uniref:ATP-binding protein n=1 Tax=Mycobacterium kubicae TaxID=120959 RepID=UPI001FD32D27|nr:ATP-binding protein [Mycobacterium kubicae]